MATAHIASPVRRTRSQRHPVARSGRAGVQGPGFDVFAGRLGARRVRVAGWAVQVAVHAGARRRDVVWGLRLNLRALSGKICLRQVSISMGKGVPPRSGGATACAASGAVQSTSKGS